MSKHRIEVSVAVEIDIADDVTTITRCTENLDDEDNPQPVGPDGEKGWQDYYYPLDTPEEVLQHLAFNAVANGITDASRLDGWSDLEPGQTTMRVDRSTVDFWPSEAVSA